MPHTPADSAIRVNRSLEEEIAKASSQAEVQSILRRAALDQKVVTPDAFDPNVLLPVEHGNAQKFSKTVTIDGQSYTATGSTELEAEQGLTQIYREHLAEPRAAAAVPAEDAAAAEQQAVATAELRMRMVRGEITPQEYLAESGEIDRYLASRGIDMHDLKSAADEKSAARFEQSWSDATETFLRSREGSDWCGGQVNLETIGRVLADNGWTDAEDKTAALIAAYQYMKENHLVVEQPAENKISQATSFSEIRDALGRGGSSIFGGR